MTKTSTKLKDKLYLGHEQAIDWKYTMEILSGVSTVFLYNFLPVYKLYVYITGIFAYAIPHFQKSMPGFNSHAPFKVTPTHILSQSPLNLPTLAIEMCAK